MAGFNSTAANSFLLLYFQTTTWANVAINATSSPITDVFLSLHTATPSGGTQSTSEAGYSSYARVSEVRSTSSPGFTIATNVATLAATASFPTSSGTPNETETYMGIGQSSSGAGVLDFYGTISPNIVVTTSGVTPSLTTSTQLTLS